MSTDNYFLCRNVRDLKKICNITVSTKMTFEKYDINEVESIVLEGNCLKTLRLLQNC